MTLDELDEALKKLGVDYDYPEGLRIRDMILQLHGEHLLNSKKTQCSRCWIKDKNRTCSQFCKFSNLPEDNPIEASKMILNSPRNGINLMSFMVLFVIPIYEKVTGNVGLLDTLSKSYKKRWKREHKGQFTTYD